jgi:general L-amino acid transport system permease protein
VAGIQVATKPPFWRDVRTISWAFQLVVLGLFIAIIAILYNNVRVNSANQGLPVGFDFLDQPSDFTIPGNDLRTTQPVRDAIFEGVLNTLRVVVLGIILATIIGIAVGIGRLSGNWLVRNLTLVYVEAIRNVPLLGLVIFSYLAIALSVFPTIDNSWIVDGLLVANGRGISAPWITGSGVRLLAVLAVAAVVGLVVRRWRNTVQDRTGAPTRMPLYVIPPVVATALIGAAVVGVGLSGPTLDGRVVTGGITMPPEYFALLVALTVYTSSHIAEIFRGSIQAVPRGQGEAASAMALSSWQRMRYVILPQSLRIALPPLGNQYLNLLKNSSLGLAISYFELTKVTQTTIGNRSPAVPAFTLLIVLYLIGSLTLSLLVNYFNRRLAIDK